MHKLIFLTSLMTPLVNKSEQSHIPYAQSPVQMNNFNQTFTVDMVKNLLKRYPELNWLADKNVQATQENSPNKHPEAYSVQIFGEFYSEFERSFLSINCLHWILDGSIESHAKFIKGQTAPQLSFESFQKLHQMAQNCVTNYAGLSKEEMIQILETGLVLGDMGKSKIARDMLSKYGITAPDHDDFYGEAILNEQANQALPSFQKLPLKGQKLLQESAHLAHYGHITHAEGGPNMFSNLKQSNIIGKAPLAFDVNMLIHICDVAGALGHVNNHSSLVLNQNSFDAMEAVIKACKTLVGSDEKAAYLSYLNTRAQKLNLDVSTPQGQVLARIAAMCRLFTISEGKALEQGFVALDPAERATIIHEFSIGGANQLPRTPTYMPAVLVNLINNQELGKDRLERIKLSLKYGLPSIAKILQNYKDMLQKGELHSNVPLNFNQIAGAVRNDPRALLNREFSIDKTTGEVLVKNKNQCNCSASQDS
ncbi:MAG: hypothetical protein K0S74_1624 [Chlamydiales bacterium]|jgi:hypothetical protein|nr:hypothetical protein [Chlamydiales bacterium]